MARIPLVALLTVCAALFSALSSTLSAAGQSRNPFGDLQPQAGKTKSSVVTYLFPEQVTVAAGKPTAVDLHFNVAAGLHINSHNPHTDDLIPTTFKLPENSGVLLANANFPEGHDFAFPISPKEKLSVYTGEFTIHAELNATRGEHLVEATLRYQACDNNACMPPHSIPVVIDVIAK
ncbi:protein-disulfide reductase DsbD N-terminal domain-containing protein [Acidicapsa ligni]|uniref:protein-disulfide reductase DsbD N-terminal domain-containing protein n=1 Tax=Acidicapsa ligni TaxID=542300 RepID=UPI0021E0C978|nr:protein-disulfide reductase DsbD N-terminal domain-containing protein [Acidicapsa ligni]